MTNTCVDSSGKCRIAATETGLCYNDEDDDCDGPIDFADTDCCGVEGAYCSSDFMCCGAMPCDGPGNKCGCPDGFYWDEFSEDCILSGESCAPPSNCNVNPLQSGCIRDTFPNPFSSTQACCEDITYGGTTYYDWSTSHITTY